MRICPQMDGGVRAAANDPALTGAGGEQPAAHVQAGTRTGHHHEEHEDAVRPHDEAAVGSRGG